MNVLVRNETGLSVRACSVEKGDGQFLEISIGAFDDFEGLTGRQNEVERPSARKYDLDTNGRGSAAEIDGECLPDGGV